MNQTATEINEAIYQEFWESCPDFTRYNPGVLHRRRAILKRLSSLTYKTVLDVGCGNGELIVWLKERTPPAEFWGVDLSASTIARNQTRHPHTHFEVLNIEHQQLDRTFDVIICTEILEHLDDRPGAMRRLAAMLNPGGHLILTCPAGKVHATERHFGHVSHPTTDELRAMATAANLQVVSLDNWGFPIYKSLKYLTNVNPEWALRSFADGKYGTGARFVSRALYLANFFNLPSSTGGCQQFLVARR